MEKSACARQAGETGVACILVEGKETYSQTEYGKYSIFVTRMT
jgi:hypothetical protein